MALVAVAALAVPAEATWSQYKGNPSRTGLAPPGGIFMGPPGILAQATLPAPASWQPVLADLDNDGDLDVLVPLEFDVDTQFVSLQALQYDAATGGFSLWWKFNVPKSTLLCCPPQYAPNMGFSRVAVGDLDGNANTKEVLLATEYRTSSGGAWYPYAQFHVLNGATGASLGTVAAPFASNSAIPTTTAPLIGDIDGDGKNEGIFLRVDSPTVSYVIAVGMSGSSVTTKFSTFFSGTIGAAALGEVSSAHNGLELLIGTEVSATQGSLFMCSPTATAPNCSQVVTVPSSVKGISVTDLGGPNGNEIVVNGRSGTSLTVVTSQPFAVASSMANGFLWTPSALGDVDLDGFAEMVNVPYSEFIDDPHTVGTVTVRGFNAGAIVAEGQWVRTGPMVDSRGGGILADVWSPTNTPDQRPEFIFPSQDKTLVFTKFTGASDATPGSTPSLLWSVALDGVPTTPAYGDVNGDCRGDFVLATDAGTLYMVGDKTPFLPPSGPSLLASAGVGAGPSVFVDLAWDPPGFVGGSPISGYTIYRDTVPNPTTVLASVPAGQTTYKDTTVAPATTYYYRVEATNCAGGGSSADAVAKTADIIPPSAVAAVSAVGTTTSVISVSWTPATDNVGIAGYEVYYDDDPAVDLSDPFFDVTKPLASPSASIPTNLLHTQLPVDTFYYYRVRAYDTSGNPGPLSPVLNLGIPGVTISAGGKTLNNPPTAQPASVYGTLGSVLVDLSPLAFEPDGGTGSLLFDVQPPYAGAATVSGPLVEYQAPPGPCGPDIFWYSVREPDRWQFDPAATTPGKMVNTALSSKSALVHVNPCVPNGGPVAKSQAFTTPLGTPVSFILDAFDPQPGPAPLAYTIVTPPAHGVLSGTAPVLTYSRNGGCGGDAFLWQVTDGMTTTQASVSVKTLCSQNEPPEAFPQVLKGFVGEPLAIRLGGFDQEGAPITFHIVQEPAFGTLTGAGADWTFLADDIGIGILSFVASDGIKVSQPATVTLEIVQAPPVRITRTDADLDGTPDVADNCARGSNPDQRDSDFDSVGDPCDVRGPATGAPAPKRAPPPPPQDTDGDGAHDGVDNCLRTRNPDQADLDGDGQGDLCDVDVDGDGHQDSLDNCPRIANPRQADADGDLVGDVCDTPAALAAEVPAARPPAADREPARKDGLPSWVPVALAGGGLAMVVLAAAIVWALRRRA